VQGEPTPTARALAAALRETGDAVLDGSARDEAVAEAVGTGLSPALAERYVERLLDPDRGLVAGGRVDRASLDAVVGLRRRFMPAAVAALLDGATDSAAGLVDDGPLSRG